MTTYTWAGGASGAWAVAANWGPVSGVPGVAGDEAIIPLSGETITMSGGTYALGVLQLATGSVLELTGGALLTLAAPAPSGDLTNLSGTLVVDGASKVTFQGVVSGMTDITGNGVADFVQAFTQSATFTGPGALQLNVNFNPGIVYGFGSGDSIDLLAIKWAQQAAGLSLGPGNVLTISEGGDSSSIFLDPSKDYSGYTFHLADDLTNAIGGDGTLVTVVPCFGRGTRIATNRGEVAVEDLAVGDLAATLSGALRPVRWIGHRSLNLACHPAPHEIYPVCVRAGAFGEGLPHRDLWLSPGHALAFEGVLIEARTLVNGLSVQQIEQTLVEYWHVELDAHDVLLAEGLPAESYLDSGNRAGFDNAGAFLEAHPDFRPRHWAATCLPLVDRAPEVERARALLRQRLQAQGYELTNDADAHIDADGERVDPIVLSPKRLAFAAPPGARALALRSHVFTPLHTMEGRRDRRELGLCVARLQIDGAEVALDRDEALGAGWQEAERAKGAFSHRWTAGAALLPTGARLIVVDLAGQGIYWREPKNAAALFA